MEEIEALQSIFPDEVLVTDTDEGSKCLQYTLKGEAVFSMELNGAYPDPFSLIERESY